jgi:hypothetical protein
MKLFAGEYPDIHSDPILGAYYYIILRNTVKLYYIKDKKTVLYNTTISGNDIPIQFNVMKPRVYPYNRNSLVICFGNNNYVYTSSEYVDQTLTNRVWNNGTIDSTLLSNYIVPEDFDLYKTVINKNDLSIMQLDPFYTSYQYTEIGSNSIYRILAILIDLKNKKNYDVNKCFIYDNFILYDNDPNYEIYPYDIQYNWKYHSKPIILEKIYRRRVYSNPNSFAYNGLIHDITSTETRIYNSANTYIFRGNILS